MMMNLLLAYHRSCLYEDEPRASSKEDGYPHRFINCTIPEIGIRQHLRHLTENDARHNLPGNYGDGVASDVPLRHYER